jgi:heme-degrading monooxygenase HmoA
MKPGEERREAFKRAFLDRESHVHKAEGFAGFELLRREGEGAGEYVVLSRWESDEAFKAWVNSDLFKMGHRHARRPGPKGTSRWATSASRS